jgi:H+-translocating NAD(P) transhydrogenase subunit alpha
MRKMRSEMQIGVPAESRSRESLVAATPETVKMLVAQGRTVTVESGAGECAH